MDRTENVGGTGVRKGRFWVTTNDESDEEETNTTAEPEPVVVRKGRFIVSTAPDDEQDIITSPSEEKLPIPEEVLSPAKPKAMSSMEVESFKTVDSFSQPEIPRSRSTTPGLDKVASTNPSPAPKLDPSPAPTPPLIPKGTSNGGEKKSPSLLFEIQKISAQNRKLHSLLLNLCNQKEELEDSEDSSSRAALIKRASSPTPPDVTPKPGSSTVAATRSTARLAELVCELNSCSSNIVLEYDTLKAKNLLLDKQLKETKTQLKTSQQLVQNLKQELEKAQAALQQYTSKEQS